MDQQLKSAVMLATNQEDIEKLTSFFTHLLENDPDNHDALHGLGVLCFKRSNYPQAATHLLKLLNKFSADEPDINHVRRMAVGATFRAAVNDDPRYFDEMIPHAEAYLDEMPGDAEVYECLCEAHLKSGNKAKVSHYLDLGMKRADRPLHFQIGLIVAASNEEQSQIDQVEESWTGHLMEASGHGTPAVRTWTPRAIGETTARLSGVSREFTRQASGAFEFFAAKEGEQSLQTILAAPTPALSSPDAGVVFWEATVRNLAAGKTYRCRLKVEDGDHVLWGSDQEFSTAAHALPTVETGSATLMGNGGVTLNGRVGGTTLPTRYWFRYGLESDRLDQATPQRDLPPARSARTMDVLSHTIYHHTQYAAERELFPLEPGSLVSGLFTKDENVPDLGVRLKSPFGKDRNHLNGVGAADLVLGWSSIVDPYDDGSGDVCRWEVNDFRDAEVTLTVRSASLDAKDFQFFCVCQSRIIGTPNDDESAQVPVCWASWSLTGQLTDFGPLLDGEWHTLRYTFKADTNEWTFNGNNPDEQENAARYGYHPLGKVLTNHLGNVCFWFLYGNPRIYPEGHLDVYSASLRYRDKSLLAPGSGARLIQWPSSSITDPGRLVNGWKGNPEEFWVSGPNPSSAQEFVWEFNAEVRVQFIRIYQNTLIPAKDVTILVSTDGKEFDAVWETALPHKRSQKATNGPVFNVFARPVQCRYLKLSIRSGYDASFWGLDAVEVFGEGAAPVPETAPCSVCEELQGLEPGNTVYFQLVAENEVGQALGEIQSHDLPEDQRPILHWAKVLKQEHNKVTLWVRMTAMGLKTELTGRFKGEDGEIIDGDPIATGCQPVPNHITYTVLCSSAKGRYRGDLVARNQAGESTPLEVQWDFSVKDDF